jgi:hypothetical protein
MTSSNEPNDRERSIDQFREEMNGLEERISQRFDWIDRRFDDIDRRLDSMNGKLDLILRRLTGTDGLAG